MRIKPQHRELYVVSEQHTDHVIIEFILSTFFIFPLIMQWPKAGIVTQRHKYTYYSHFFTVTDHVLSKKYSCNDITSISINKKTLLAEITHLWLYDSTTGYARLKLYSVPDDLPHGRTHHHGEVRKLLLQHASHNNKLFIHCTVSVYVYYKISSKPTFYCGFSMLYM